jgi:hypothetical protein
MTMRAITLNIHTRRTLLPRSGRPVRNDAPIPVRRLSRSAGEQGCAGQTNISNGWCSHLVGVFEYQPPGC